MYGDKRQSLLRAQKIALASALVFKGNLDSSLDQMVSGKRDIDDVRPQLRKMINETLLAGLVSLRDMRSTNAPAQVIEKCAEGVSDLTMSVHRFSIACEDTLNNHRDSPLYRELCRHIDTLKANTRELQQGMGLESAIRGNRPPPVDDTSLQPS